MLPEQLSTDLTSLGDGEDRMAIVVEMVVQESGEVVNTALYRATVRNKAKLAYNGVAAWLDGQGPIPDWAASVPGMESQLRLQDGVAISPTGIPAMFRILLAVRQSSPGAVDAFFASHPLEENRIRDTEALIAAYPASQLRGLPVDTQAFQTFRRRLQSLPPSPTPKQPSG